MIDTRNRPTPETFTLADRLLTEAQTAELLGLAPATLRRRRSTGDPNQPDHVKIGRSVRYPASAVAAFVAALPTSGGVR